MWKFEKRFEQIKCHASFETRGKDKQKMSYGTRKRGKKLGFMLNFVENGEKMGERLGNGNSTS